MPLPICTRVGRPVGRRVLCGAPTAARADQLAAGMRSGAMNRGRPCALLFLRACKKTHHPNDACFSFASSAPRGDREKLTPPNHCHPRTSLKVRSFLASALKKPAIPTANHRAFDTCRSRGTLDIFFFFPLLRVAAEGALHTSPQKRFSRKTEKRNRVKKKIWPNRIPKKQKQTENTTLRSDDFGSRIPPTQKVFFYPKSVNSFRSTCRFAFSLTPPETCIYVFRGIQKKTAKNQASHARAFFLNLSRDLCPRFWGKNLPEINVANIYI